MRALAILIVILPAGLVTCVAACAQQPPPVDELLYALDTGAARRAALAKLESAYPSGAAVDRERFAALERAIHSAGSFTRPERDVIDVQVPGGPRFPVHLALPEGYDGTSAWPLVLAFGGGPIPRGPRGDRAVEGQAKMMRAAWRDAAAEAGWLVAAVEDVVSRSAPGIRYEIVRPQHIESILRELRRRLNIDEDRSFMTGISLGSNYAIACGASRPELFCGAAPVSTEGEAREPLIRNLRNFPLYLLAGARDRNIRSIDGPRALRDALARFGYEHVYEEFADRGHEGFRERYPEVLAWFAERPRRFWASEVVRVPHTGIVASARAFRWIGCDTRQGVFRARVNDNRIDVDAASLGRLDLLLSDRLVDLDEPVTVAVNGSVVHDGPVARDAHFAVRHARDRLDRRQVPAARLSVVVPVGVATGAAARAFAARMLRVVPERPPLAFWEHYALRHLRETRRLPGLSGTTEDLGSGLLGLRVAAVAEGSPAAAAGVATGDVVRTFDGNPFFAGDDPAAWMDLWCLREEFAGTGIELGLDAGAERQRPRRVRVELRAPARTGR